MTYEGIRFNLASLQSECVNLQGLARPFLSRGGQASLEKLVGTLQRLKHAEPGRHRLEIPYDEPVETVPCGGMYEPGKRRGKHKHAIGTMSFVWEIELRPEKEYAGCLWLPPTGNASCEVRVVDRQDGAEDKVLGMWKTEVGAASSPGAHFHIGLSRDVDPDHPDEDEQPFPHSLTVPRFQSVLVTPFDALDFMLGELFQDAWVQRTSKKSDFRAAWASAQRTRMLGLLCWAQETIGKSEIPPWVALKREQPPAGVFE